MSGRGYTLIEILVVAVVIVLMLGMALPVFRVINGSQSEAGASNIIAAMLGRARADAVGLQIPIGTAFLYNPGTQQYYMAEVLFPQCPAWSNGLTTVQPLGYTCVTNGGVTYYYINNNSIALTLGTPPTPTALGPQPSGSPGYNLQSVGGPPLEIRQDTDLVPLPAGIGVQTVCNCIYTNTSVGTPRATDGYLNVGVILFDGFGHLSAMNYGISQYARLATLCSLGNDYPIASGNGVYANGQFGVSSQFGLVLFQREALFAQNFPTNDPTYFVTSVGNYSQQETAYTSTTNGPSQQAEENWLDQNATPLLLNRYTGTLIRAE